MARLLTREALEALYRNPIAIPDLPEYETADTIIDVSMRDDLPAPAAPAQTSAAGAEELFEQWLRAYPQPSHEPICVPPSLWSRLLSWFGGALGFSHA